MTGDRSDEWLGVVAAVTGAVVASALGVWLWGGLVAVLTGVPWPNAGPSLPRVAAVLSDPLEPRNAWPTPDRDGMPTSPVVWWGVFLIAAALLTIPSRLLIRGVLRGWRILAAGPAGSSPRHQEPPGAALSRRSRAPVLGRHGGRLVCAAPESHIVVVGPPGSAKTAAILAPALLEAISGPAVVVSTAHDLYEVTTGARGERGGDIWIFDPFADVSDGWSPLDGCHVWEVALRRAATLTRAARLDHQESAGDFWDQIAANLLAPMLFAAARAGFSVERVHAWAKSQTADQIARTIVDHCRHGEGGPALAELAAVTRHDSRNQSNAWISLERLLDAYKFPSAVSAGRSGVTPERFLDGRANTLYVTASEDDQRLVRPLVVALIDSIYRHAYDLGMRRPHDPPLWFVIDEAANVPMPDLDAMLAQCRKAGIRFLLAYQSLSQVQQRYGRAGADSILGACTTKVLLSGSSDSTTVQYFDDLAGRQLFDREGKRVPLDVSRLDGDALVAWRDRPLFTVRPRPWFSEPRLRRLVAAK
jgi:hypothetical protein